MRLPVLFKKGRCVRRTLVLISCFLVCFAFPLPSHAADYYFDVQYGRNLYSSFLDTYTLRESYLPSTNFTEPNPVIFISDDTPDSGSDYLPDSGYLLVDFAFRVDFDHSVSVADVSGHALAFDRLNASPASGTSFYSFGLLSSSNSMRTSWTFSGHIVIPLQAGYAMVTIQPYVYFGNTPYRALTFTPLTEST